MEQVPVILLSSSSSESEGGNMNRKRKYEDDYRLISDLTGFDNPRAMIEAEKSRKKRKKKKKNNPLHTSSQPVYTPPMGDTALLSTYGSKTQHYPPYVQPTGHTNGSHNHGFPSQHNRFNQARQQQGNNRFPQSQFQSQSRGQFQFQNQNHGHGPNSKGKPYLGKCQICCQQGHSTAKCSFRFNQNYNPTQMQQSFAAMNILETPSVIQSQNSDPCWYPDTGATSHMTADMPLLQQP